MLYLAFVEQARHEHMPDEYKKTIYYCIVAVVHILSLQDKHEITTLVPSELTKREKVKRTNTDFSNTWRRFKLWKLSYILLVRIVYYISLSAFWNRLRSL